MGIACRNAAEPLEVARNPHKIGNPKREGIELLSNLSLEQVGKCLHIYNCDRP